MRVGHLLTRPVSITRRTDSGEVDESGDAVLTETETETTCELQQLRRDEQDAQGDLSDTTWLLVLPPGTDTASADVVVVDGDEYEMVGDPWPVRHLRTGAETHVECTVRRTA